MNCAPFNDLMEPWYAFQCQRELALLANREICMPTSYLGIDLHKRSSTWVLLDDQRKVRLKQNVPCTPDHVTAAIKMLPVDAASERWLRFFEQNLRVVKWELLPGLGAARVSLS
jgi:hypothetical protein